MMNDEKAGASPVEIDRLLPDEECIPQKHRAWPWIASTLVFLTSTLSLSIWLLARSPRTLCSNEAPQIWRRSDLPAARNVIEYEEVLFVGNSAFDENGTVWIPNPSMIDYTGEPSPEVDAAWQDLTGERDFLISEKEAIELWGEQRKIHWHHRKNGYSIGLDMFHTLHCLDSLRKLYYPEYYHLPPGTDENIRKHRAHCIDQIRQYVMCAGDMTPYGTKYYPNPGRNYADSDVHHTCRNFKKLREWTRARYHAGGSLHLPGVDVWDG